ncbi:MAG: methyltransferase domain-containing protein [Bacteroidetes bacterium]|nr:methyltransferase domain-containing protein [Bacteroidota bacterium]
MPDDNINIVNNFALDYDKSVLKNNWNGPAIIFNEVNEYLIPKSKIIDLGIGTGESSRRFQNEGFEITGIDGSSEMLKQCEKKKIGAKLILHNLENTPFPIETNLFNAVISNGTFHLINPVKQLFPEAKRILNSDGLFAFTFENSNDTSDSREIESGVWEMKTQSGVLSYKHSEQYILGLLHQNIFEVKKQKQFLAFTNTELQKEYYFTLIVAKLK